MAAVTLAQRSGRKLNAFLTLITFVTFLLCSISCPVVPGLNFLNYQIAGTKALQIGIWGSCTFDISPTTGRYENRICSRAGVPFLVDLRSLPGSNQANPFVVGKLSIPLVLFPIATALAFLAVATSHMSGHLSMLNSQGAAGLGMVLIVIQFLLFERTDTEIRQTVSISTGGLGTCLWLGLAGGLAASIAVLAAILASAEETRKNGSLIHKEVYKMDEETSF